MNSMKAMAIEKPAPIESDPLRAIELEVPEPGPGEIRVQVRTCGVCRTDLHVAEGDLPPRRPSIVPGHEVVGRVVARGSGVSEIELGARVGVAWLHASCGRCRFCRLGRENLCVAPRFTGYDVDGGYAEHVVVPSAFAYRLPESPPAATLAPLLCAGIIGYRALLRASVPEHGRLGLYGFGVIQEITAAAITTQM